MKKQSDQCSDISETMDYVKCRAEIMEKEEGYPVDKAFATAWSIACGPKRQKGGLEDADEHCQRKPSGYFTNRNKKADEEPTMLLNASDYEEILEEEEQMRTAGIKKKSYGQMDGTVRSFIDVLVSKLTRYDQRLQRKQPNNYRLGHYFKAVDKIRKMVAQHMNSSEPQALQLLQKALCKGFSCGMSDKPKRGYSLPPVVNVSNQIDAFLMSGKMPKLASSDDELTAEQEEILAGQTPESFKKMMKENPKLKEEWEKQIKENEGVVEKKAGCENLPNEAMQKNCEEKKKEGEANKEKEEAKKEAAFNLESRWTVLAGCENLPNEAMVKNCEDKKKEGEKNKEKEEAKKEATLSEKWAALGKGHRWASATRNLHASWGLTAFEARDLLAEEELEAYLSEIFAEEILAGPNHKGRPKGTKTKNKDVGNFIPYEEGKFDPNMGHEERKGKGRGTGGANHVYNDYGSLSFGTPGTKEYAKNYNEWYGQQGYWNPKKRKSEPRSICPKMPHTVPSGAKSRPCKKSE